MLEEKIGKDTTMKDLKTHLAVTSTLLKDTDHPCGFIFAGSDEACDNFTLVDVCLATSAAPLFFPPHTFADKVWVDGAVVANNPSLYAHAEASRYVDNPKQDILHISLSTGFDPGDTLVDNGANVEKSVFWAVNIGSIAMDGTRRMSVMATPRFYSDDKANQRFYRFEPIFKDPIPLDGLEYKPQMTAAAELLMEG
jgi:predicted acylesterase/phospholipase RssA